MDPVNHPHESGQAKQYINTQSQHGFPGHAGNYSSTGTGDANSLRSMLPGNYAKSKGSSSAFFVSTAPTTADTATILRTSVGSSFSAHLTPFGHNKQETDAATTSTHSKGATTKAAMPCICCWASIQDLTRHYPKCSYIKGDWAFWAYPYTLEILRDGEAFTNHIKSFKPDEKRIEIISARPKPYVSARIWATQYPKHAIIRQLVNTVFEYFNANPGLADQWKALNNDELIPILNSDVDVRKVLNLSSMMLRRRTAPGSDRLVEEVSIDQHQRIFRADATVVTKSSSTQSDISSKRRRRNDTPNPYTALEIVNKDANVEIGDASFDSAELAAHQQQQLAGENQGRSFCSGGVIAHPPSLPRAPPPANAMPTVGTSIALGGQTEWMPAAPNNISSNPAEVLYGMQDYFTYRDGLQPPPQMPQTLLERQSVGAPTGANDLFSASYYYNPDDSDAIYWES